MVFEFLREVLMQSLEISRPRAMKTLILFQKSWRSLVSPPPYIVNSLSFLQKLVCFSSSSVPNPRFSGQFSRNPECEESLVYRHKLQFQRPTKVKLRDRPRNLVSLIGSVVFPVKITKSGFDFYTLLEVRSSHGSNRTFRILLMMRNKMAEIAYRHLKQNDFIYVSGCLSSYRKANESGKLETFYKVTAEELNYVARTGKCQNSQKSEQSVPKEEGTIPVSYLDKKKGRMHLWQVFFVNPYEWWDNRRDKVNPRQPDFRHKDSGEALWLSPTDPPWVTRQLQLYDSNMAAGGHLERGSSRSHVSMWKYEE